jgi:FMN-dependent NADH-azoreductase
MKTLVVSYLPRGERSHTKKLLDAFLEAAEGQNVEHLDLLEDLPDVFLSDNLHSYIMRNYMGETLSEQEQAGLAKMDRMTRQLKDADAVVLAFPMHNFSVPAIVKGWFDSVMQKDETWTVGDNGYVPLMTGKKALVLMASGGVYEGDFAGYEHATTLAQAEFGFMGFETEIVSAGGMNMLPNPEEVVAEKQDEVKSIAKEWYQ